MGEKLIAQSALRLLRANAGKGSREAAAALEWAADQRDWLWPHGSGTSASPVSDLDWDSLTVAVDSIETGEDETPLDEAVTMVADLLTLGQFDRDLVHAVATLQRTPALGQLRAKLVSAGTDLVRLMGGLAGAPFGEAAARVRRSQAVSLGLLSFEQEYGASVELQLEWSFGRILDEGAADSERVIEALAGARQTASLEPADFAERHAELDLLTRLLRGALRTAAAARPQ